MSASHPNPLPPAPPPLTAEEIRRAEDAARNEDGTIDPFLFAAEVARRFGVGRSWEHPHFVKPEGGAGGSER